ncbi:hypothetical protein MKW92_028807, partial [Papaver armeniacum]
AVRFECRKCPIGTQASKMEFHKCPNETECFAQATKRATEKGKGPTEEEVCTDVGRWKIYVEKISKIKPKVYGPEERKKLRELQLAAAMKERAEIEE